MGWVFQGNPKAFDIDDYLSRYPELIYWRTPRYASEIAIGDRAFLWRAGSEAGAVAIGVVVERPTPANRVQHPEALGEDLWIAERPDPAEKKTGIRIEELRVSPSEMVPRHLVKEDSLLATTTLITMPNGTVFRLSAQETETLERLWGISSALAAESSVSEGERKLRAHFVRERSPRLRADKVSAFRAEHGHLRCEICGHAEVGVYPSGFGDKMFEVHHRAPLAKTTEPIRTTLADLAVLCANCHRSVHSTKAVEDNYNCLVSHFSERS
ncbi:MAG: EVE domain-containing protein [Phycisphaeraceae bacterium]|nr:EVE domain-containing protein [Phycisphaeraceae bacterium]